MKNLKLFTTSLFLSFAGLFFAQETQSITEATTINGSVELLN